MFSILHIVRHFESSNILSTEPHQFSQQLEKWLPRLGNWSICWRATEHGWEAGTFHKNCDGKAPTLTLVKVVKDRKNMTFGGYATRAWDDPGEFYTGGMFLYVVPLIIFLMPRISLD